jgi:hypothetical protein
LQKRSSGAQAHSPLGRPGIAPTPTTAFKEANLAFEAARQRRVQEEARRRTQEAARRSEEEQREMRQRQAREAEARRRALEESQARAREDERCRVSSHWRGQGQQPFRGAAGPAVGGSLPISQQFRTGVSDVPLPGGRPRYYREGPNYFPLHYDYGSNSYYLGLNYTKTPKRPFVLVQDYWKPRRYAP